VSVSRCALLACLLDNNLDVKSVTARAFLCCADAALNVGDMFVIAADVQLGLAVSGNSSARAFEFGITDDEVDFEAALAIDAMDTFRGFDERVFFSVVEDLRGDETDLSGNRHK
jgi:hypothetical protein